MAHSISTIGGTGQVLQAPIRSLHNRPWIRGQVMPEQHSVAPSSEQVEYRSVVGFSGYRVGDDGSVWVWCIGALASPRPSRPPHWRKMRPMSQKSGHLHIIPVRDRVRSTKLVHRLVLEAFVGPCPVGMECCHEDGDPTNNRLSNLRWGTKKSNEADKLRHGTYGWGEKNSNAKLTEVAVREIKALLLAKMSQGKIAKRFNVHNMTISRIARGIIWRHVQL